MERSFNFLALFYFEYLNESINIISHVYNPRPNGSAGRAWSMVHGPWSMTDFQFYFSLGWHHIVTTEALDHLLFIAALASIYLLRDWKKVLILVTAFTVGHTITLILSTKELIEIKSSLVEFLIPCTIIITAVSNLFQKSYTGKTVRLNYFMALFFGLIHGLAFANVLRMILASDQNFALSMFSFSMGLELGQILVVILMLILAQVVVRMLKIQQRLWVVFVSIVVLGFAVWMASERWIWN